MRLDKRNREYNIQAAGRVNKLIERHQNALRRSR